MSTEMGEIATCSSEPTEEPTPLQREIDNLGRTLGHGVIAIAVLVIDHRAAHHGLGFGAADFVDVLLLGVSLAVAAVPEGLPAVLSVVLALGVQRMAKQQRHRQEALVGRDAGLGLRHLHGQDRHADTQPDDHRARRHCIRRSRPDGRGLSPEGSVTRRRHGQRWRGLLREEHARARRRLARERRPARASANGAWEIQGDPTEAAFLVAARKLEARRSACSTSSGSARCRSAPSAR